MASVVAFWKSEVKVLMIKNDDRAYEIASVPCSMALPYLFNLPF